ncbi:DUF1801 domain-containing protein [Parasphingorhabdus sp.]|uniref:DUF1801 domain-containing protein n=1 Tax=Parasphingorhabdus sp. TaxID=2709688 RepID=UPI003263743E
MGIAAQTQSVFEDLPAEMASRLRDLRTLILETASENPAIGPLEETLKWGEPAFLTSATKSGTTIRINRHKKSDDRYAFYVHCQTDLVERYRQLYADTLDFEGNRAVVFNLNDDIPADAVKHCIAMALTYHLK